MAHVPPISRRAALRVAMLAAGAAAAGSVAACGVESAPARSATTTTPTASVPPADADVDLVTSAIDAEATLLALCEATGRRHPGLDHVVASLITTQRAHVAGLTASLANPPSAPSSPGQRVFRNSKSALSALMAAFSAAEQDRLSDCLHATSGLLARLLASTSAAHAVSVEAVRAAR